MNARISSHIGASARLRRELAGPENRVKALPTSFVLSDLVGLKRSQQLLSAIVEAHGKPNWKRGAGIRTAVRFSNDEGRMHSGVTK